MHAIIFENSAEEANHPASGAGISLTVTGGAGLRHLAPGDTLWVATRLGDDRAAPALCGRLVVSSVGGHAPGSAGYDASEADRPIRLVADRGRSSRCFPFSCPMIAAWGVWRSQFRGVALLSEEQGAALEAEWLRAQLAG